MSGVRRDASVRPMLRGADTEWLPKFGLSWQLVQVPVNEAGVPKAASSLIPETPTMVIGLELNNAWPRTIDARPARVSEFPEFTLFHVSYKLKALGVNAAPVRLSP